MIEFDVSGDRIERFICFRVIRIILLISPDTEDLVTVMWANESFDLNHPDTYFEPVKKE